MNWWLVLLAIYGVGAAVALAILLCDWEWDLDLPDSYIRGFKSGIILGAYAWVWPYVSWRITTGYVLTERGWHRGY